MTAIEPTVFVIDDDKAIRSAVKNLLESVGIRAEVFSSPREFLKGESKDKPGCLVLDVRLPGASGLDFQGELAKAHVEIPVIFITGHGDIPMSVQAMKAGAMDFLTSHFVTRISWTQSRGQSAGIRPDANNKTRESRFVTVSTASPLANAK